jgi:secondary thiamine-phosphate synthase enzyme
MSQYKKATLRVQTPGRGLFEISDQINAEIRLSAIENGLAHVFIQHTSASLLITENADPTVLLDLETIISRLSPDGDPEFKHNYEGDDDMAAHVRSVLTHTSLSIPIHESRLALGTWQGVYLWEHRYRAHARKIILTLQGFE